MAGQENRQ